MSKLRIKLYNEGNLVIFRVLNQCESITEGIEKKFFNATNGFLIKTKESPELYMNRTVYIRGTSREKDTFATSLSFTNEEAAKVYIERALDAFQEFSDNNYFSGKKRENDSKEKHVYEF